MKRKVVFFSFWLVLIFLAGCGTLYIEGTPSFTGPSLNRDLTAKPSVTIQWLNGKNVMVTSGRDSSSFCDSGVVGHTLENWLGLRGAQPVVRKDTAEYEIMVYSDHDRSGYWSSITTVRVRLRILDRLGNVRATSKGESSAWEYQSWADEDKLCEDAARRAVLNLK